MNRTSNKTFKVSLSNGKVATVEAPSAQRAAARIQKMIDAKGSSVTITKVM